MNVLKSKTILFSIVVAVLGVLEQSQAALSAAFGPENSGLIMICISVITVGLRIITTMPLSEK